MCVDLLKKNTFI